MPKIIALGGPLTPLAIEEPLLLSKQFCCYSPQHNINGMCKGLMCLGLAIISYTSPDIYRLDHAHYCVWEVQGYYCTTGDTYDAIRAILRLSINSKYSLSLLLA